MTVGGLDRAKKRTQLRKKFYVHEVSEKIWLSIQIELNSSSFFFHDTVWIDGPLGQAISLLHFLHSCKLSVSKAFYSFCESPISESH